MTRSKKIILAFALGVFGLLAVLVYDVSTRTTFPGAQKNQKSKKDSLFIQPDTLKATRR